MRAVSVVVLEPLGLVCVVVLHVRPGPQRPGRGGVHGLPRGVVPECPGGVCVPALPRFFRVRCRLHALD